MNYGTPVPLQFLPLVDDVVPESLLPGYDVEGYSLDFNGQAAGRWFHVYTNDIHSGVVWTDDDEACGVIAVRRPDFDASTFTATALTLRLLHDSGMPATDAFNVLADLADVTEVSVGALEMLNDEIVT